MSEEYSCYQYAIELGFTETEAQALQASKLGKGQDATVLRRLAAAKRLPSSKPTYPMPTTDPAPGSPADTVAVAVTQVKRKRRTIHHRKKRE